MNGVMLGSSHTGVSSSPVGVSADASLT
jgi:hypothetical protein